MLTGHVVTNILQSPAIMKPTMELYPGQILRGQIMKLLPEQQALVQIGNLNVLAQMENNLAAGDRVWLQVQKGGHPAVLKILKTSEKSFTGKSGKDHFSELMEALAVEDTKENRNIINRLIVEKLPVQAKDVSQMKEFIQHESISLDTVIFAIRRGIPLSMEGLQALEEFFSGIQKPETLGSLFSSILEQTGASTELNTIASRVLQLVGDMAGFSQQTPSGNEIQHLLKLLDELNIQLTRLLSTPKLHHGQEKLEKITRFITGQQLLLSPTASPVQQWVIFLPLAEELQGFVQIESQKQRDGRIDPENCRMLFCFDLLALGSIVVELLITQKFVSMDISGNYPKLENLTQKFRSELTDGLKECGYILSGLKTGTSATKGRSKNTGELLRPYKGVDFRI